MNKPTINIDIERRRIRTSEPYKGMGHIKLWMTFILRDTGKKEWKQRPYKTNLFCTVEEFDIVMDDKAKRVATRIQDIRDKLTEIKAKANHIINVLKVTEQKAFEALFLSEHDIEAIAGQFEIKIAELYAAKKFSSREKYATALYSLSTFFKTTYEVESVTFNMCTPERLQAYEDWYTAQARGKKIPKKKSLTSVGINMRCLRHIFKRAIKAGITNLYPFGIGLYVIPEGGDDTKKFLVSDEKQAFIDWTHENDKINELHDYARFSYYASGINMADIARLRKPSVFKEYISIDRQKTKGRKKKSKKLIIPMHPAMVEIMRKRGNKSLIPDDYIFPILTLDMDEEAIFYRIRKLVDNVNEVLKLIGNDLKFEIKPTSYTMRHSFSFQFMQLGGTTDELQDALAHLSNKTTENYKHGFSLERKKKFSDGL